MTKKNTEDSRRTSLSNTSYLLYRILDIFDRFLRDVEHFKDFPQSRSNNGNPYTEEDKEADRKKVRDYLNGEGKDIDKILKETNSLFDERMLSSIEVLKPKLRVF